MNKTRCLNKSISETIDMNVDPKEYGNDFDVIEVKEHVVDGVRLKLAIANCAEMLERWKHHNPESASDCDELQRCIESFYEKYFSNK